MKKVKLSSLGSLLKSKDKAQQYVQALNFPAGWVRIATSSFPESSGIITILNNFQTNNSQPLKFSYIANSVTSNIIALHKQGDMFPRVRIVRISNEIYIEVFMSSQNGVFIILSQNINCDLLDTPVIGSIPDGGSVVEFTV